MAKERLRRFHEKKCLNFLKSVHHVVHSFHFSHVVLSTQFFKNVFDYLLVYYMLNCGMILINSQYNFHASASLKITCTKHLRNLPLPLSLSKGHCMFDLSGVYQVHLYQQGRGILHQWIEFQQTKSRYFECQLFYQFH